MGRPEADRAGASAAGKDRAGPARLLWSRALPGTVVAVAALALPEFSVGAGDLPLARRAGSAAPVPAPAAILPVAAPALLAEPAAVLPPVALPRGRPVAVALAPAAAADPAGDFRPAPAGLVATGAADPGGADQAGGSSAAAAPASPAATIAFAAVAPGAPTQGRADVLASLDYAGAGSPLSLPALLAAPTFGFLTPSLAVADVPFAPVELGTVAFVPAIESDPDDPAPGPVAPAMAAVSSAPVLADGGALAASVGDSAPRLAIAPDRTVPGTIGTVSAASQRPAPDPVALPPASAVIAGSDLPGIAASAAAPQMSSAPSVAVQVPSAPAASPRLPAVAATGAAALAPAAPARAAPAASGPVLPPSAPAASAPIPPRAERPALAGIPRVLPQAAASGGSAQAADMFEISSQLLARIDGRAAGKLDFRQTATGLQVRIGSLAEILADRFAPATLARMRESSSSNVYLPLAHLQAQGIPISYDPVYDEFNIGALDTRPKAAAKVHMEQISTPERGPGSAFVAPVPRRR